MYGTFITLEGVEGAGKTTILHELHQYLLEKELETVVTREPGGIEIAEKIRNVILDRSHTNMDARTEALLYAAARRQHLVEKVIPNLEAGKVILCDRFIDSSLAYQGFARDLGIDEVFEINKFAIKECMPHITLLLNLDPRIGMERIWSNTEREQNRLDLESLSFHEKVYEGYQLLIRQFPQRIKVIDADQPYEKVLKECIEALENYFNTKNA
ncbi:dTMP kinase [Salirhabdus euzebyi]|uniref:Thymidylate kinase n=1 Tax=Salirhabdus euzebyi TaxID=394506 RepID=A0A841QAI6_9BACI|nr:dTMP kinase [Salirhabdus euzebyi]MBB6455222.1 dTMP kinase [Salirhabdus euzebyi]